jgi:hypothetical protein
MSVVRGIQPGEQARHCEWCSRLIQYERLTEYHSVGCCLSTAVYHERGHFEEDEHGEGHDAIIIEPWIWFGRRWWNGDCIIPKRDGFFGPSNPDNSIVLRTCVDESQHDLHAKLITELAEKLPARLAAMYRKKYREVVLRALCGLFGYPVANAIVSEI